MTKVAIITGVTGQDGVFLSRFLLDKGYIVVGIDRRTSSKTDWRLNEAGVINHPNFNIASGDITDQGSVSRLVQEWKPTEFYNLAAMSFVGESWQTPAATMKINAVGCINCLEALRNYAPDCRFYQASSSEMFGGANRVEVLNEDSRFYPRSPYGVSKVAAHWSTINYRESFDMFTCCGILFNHESEYRGLEFVTRKITDGAARIYMGCGEPIRLGNMDSYRDWGYSGDFVRGMWLMLQQDEPDDYVLATNEAHSVREFVNLSLEIADIPGGIPGNITPDKRFMRPADVGHLLGDYSKAKERLGWEPTVSFPEMVTLMVEKDIERVRNETRNN